MATSTSKPTPPATYVAKTSAVVGLKDGTIFHITKGYTLLSGDHEAVKRWPQFFDPAADAAR